MPKSIIAEGRTTNEAISNGLKELKVSKDQVEIKVLENEEKRSFFSILTPRVVKVELTLKENAEKRNTPREKGSNRDYEEKTVKKISPEEMQMAKENVEKFLEDFVKAMPQVSYKVETENEFLSVSLQGENASKLIGYRGDVLNSLQILLNTMANKNISTRAKVILNIGDYKEKRQKALEDLAEKISKTVLKTGKSVTLEPMMAYERKIIHNKLQQNNEIKTYSIGEEPYRKVVISKK